MSVLSRWLLVLLIINGCTTSRNVRVRSVPEGATVTAMDSEGSGRVLGASPLETNEQMQALLIEKDGYEPAHIFLGRAEKQNYDFTVRLTKKAEDSKLTDSRARQEKLAQAIARANNLIVNKRFSEAEGVLTGLTADYPFVSVIYDLLGNINYLQKDFRSALNYYERSLSINGENEETKQVIQRLRAMSNQENL